MKKEELKIGKKYRVFDYGNEIIDEIVFILENDIYSGDVIYEIDNRNKFYFTGQGYFEEININ